MIELSVVIPAHNEMLNVQPMAERLNAILKNIYSDDLLWELIFVDDGSTDETPEIIKRLSCHNQSIKLIQLARNFGHQAALIAGISNAKGQAIVALDCDFQHPPELLPQMLGKWYDGSLVVQMVRKDTKNISNFKKFYSELFYKSINLISNSKIVPNASDFFLIDRTVASLIISIQDPSPFIRGLIGWMGFKKETISYIAENRRYGEPSYTFKKSLSLAHKAVISLSCQPLRASMYLAISIILVCMLYAFYIMIATFLNKTVPGWSSLMLIILSLSAIQLIALGVIGEYIFQIFIRSRKLPIFVKLSAPSHGNKGKANIR